MSGETRALTVLGCVFWSVGKPKLAHDLLRLKYRNSEELWTIPSPEKFQNRADYLKELRKKGGSLDYNADFNQWLHEHRCSTTRTEFKALPLHQPFVLPEGHYIAAGDCDDSAVCIGTRATIKNIRFVWLTSKATNGPEANFPITTVRLRKPHGRYTLYIHDEEVWVWLGN